MVTFFSKQMNEHLLIPSKMSTLLRSFFKNKWALCQNLISIGSKDEHIMEIVFFEQRNGHLS